MQKHKRLIAIIMAGCMILSVIMSLVVNLMGL